MTGVFFREQTADSLVEAILSFESSEETFVPQHIQLHARKFDTSVFLGRMHKYINCAVADSLET
jgi:hypothetical protein